jgi:Lysozyme like domain
MPSVRARFRRWEPSVVSVPKHRRNRKIRRTGRHMAPSQAAKVVQKAGKAAPAIAVAGALTVTAQPHKPSQHGPVAAEQVIRLDAHRAARYEVRPGDTLPGPAQRFYRQAVAWPWLYRVSGAAITGPGLIFPGLVLDGRVNPPVLFPASRKETGGAYVPRHAVRRPTAGAHSPTPAAAAPRDGIYSYTALEQLWVAEGGNPAHAAFAACIAEHESSGNPGAISPTSDYGLWQEHDDPAALNPAVSAQTAVEMSADGTDWSPWTTEPDC